MKAGTFERGKRSDERGRRRREILVPYNLIQTRPDGLVPCVQCFGTLFGVRLDPAWAGRSVVGSR